MSKVQDHIQQIYLTEETNCAETMFRSTLRSRGVEEPENGCRMMSGFSGGCSSHRLCGAVIGGIAAVSLLVNQGDDESFDQSKELTEAFINRCEARLGTVNCEEIMEKWRTEEERCFRAVLQVAEEMEETLESYEESR